MSNQDLLTLYHNSVQKDWVDYNGHMNDACYGIVFTNASEKFIDYIGMNAQFREQNNCTIYTIESHICYLSEAKEGEKISVSFHLLGFDEKRLRLMMYLYRDTDNELLATQETMYLHIDASGPKVCPFNAETYANLEKIWTEQKNIQPPKQAGQAIRSLKNDITQ